MGAAHADVCRFGRSVGDLLYFRDLLFLRSKRLADVALGRFAIACYAMSLAPVVWVVLSEIFSCPHTRDGNGAFHFLSLGGLFLADLYLPDPERGGRRFGYVLAVCRDLFGRFPLYTG